MSSTLYFYSPHERKELNTIWESESQWLDDFLHELYESCDDKSFLEKLDSLSDELALVEAHPIHQELCFEDLNIDESKACNEKLSNFFKQCRSCLVFQNLPDFHLNPLQVSVLKHALTTLPLVLVDGFEDETVCLGEDFLTFIKGRFKSLELIEMKEEITRPKKLQVSVDDPLTERIERILLIMRGLDAETQKNLSENLKERSPKLEKLIEQLCAGTHDPSTLWKKSGLNAKDFSDGIERIYFFYHH